MEGKEVRPNAVRAMRRMNGALRAEIIVPVKETGETMAYRIENPRGVNPYSMVDGRRYELSPRESEKLREELERVGA